MKLHDTIEAYLVFKHALGMRLESEGGVLRSFCRTMGDGDIADGGVGDAGAEAHGLGAGGHECEKWEGFFPDDVGVEDPAVGEAGGFGLLGQADDAVDVNVGFDRDAEIHDFWPSSVRRFSDRLDFAHQNKIGEKAHGETDKPRVVVQHAERGHEKSHESNAGACR